MGSFSIWHWLIVLVIVALIFGTKKIRNIGADLAAQAEVARIFLVGLGFEVRIAASGAAALEAVNSGLR